MLHTQEICLILIETTKEEEAKKNPFCISHTSLIPYNQQTQRKKNKEESNIQIWLFIVNLVSIIFFLSFVTQHFPSFKIWPQNVTSHPTKAGRQATSNSSRNNRFMNCVWLLFVAFVAAASTWWK